LGPVEAITTCLRKSFDFSGRASRAEFWWFAPIAIGILAHGLYDEWFFRLLGHVFHQKFVLQTIQIGFVVALMPVYAALSRRLNDVRLPGKLALVLPGFALIGPALAIAADSSDTFSISGKTRGMPELEYVFTVYLAMFALLLLIALLPTRQHNDVLQSHEVSP
jgi:uncharacterized membrane protein YhaH (DUF805 family)